MTQDAGTSGGLASDRKTPPPSKALRVLVVDDNVDSATTMGVFLDLCGYSTQMAFDGVEAVRAANEFHPDVILMDIGLPGMNGLDAARAIRNEAWARDTTLIAVSGWSQDADRQRSREAGFDHHLVKPVDHIALTEIVNAVATSRT